MNRSVKRARQMAAIRSAANYIDEGYNPAEVYDRIGAKCPPLGGRQPEVPPTNSEVFFKTAKVIANWVDKCVREGKGDGRGQLAQEAREIIRKYDFLPATTAAGAVVDIDAEYENALDSLANLF